jgi:hypothetical protein
MTYKRVFANKAATDLSGKDGYVAKYDTAGLAVCSAITDQPVGVISKGGDTTLLQTEVVMHGEATAICGGTITAGQMITSHTDGTIVASAGSGCTEFGIALEAGVAGSWINIFVLGGHKQWA